MNSEIYLDANATSPTLPVAAAAADDALRARFGNPSSSHAAGLRAKALLDSVRSRARRLLGAGAGRLTFTSGATEGIQTAVLSALCDIRARQQKGETVGELLLYGATEHKAVPESLAHWNAVLGTGLRLQALPVDADGRHSKDALRELAPRAAMVCTMAANNETGVISDIKGIESVLAECAPTALWMVDSVQALGKLRLDLAATRIDYAPFSGHKLYAPKGIGMLYVRAGAPYTALMMGGGQEAGQRSGTENMAGIAALGAVLAALEEGGTFRSHDQLHEFRERLAQALRTAFPGIVFNMPFEHSLPTTLNFSVAGLASKELLDLFDAAGVRVSSGSACSASKAAPSYVLDAMGLPAWRSGAAVRMSFGPIADDAFIAAACARILRCGAALHASGLLPDAAGQQAHDGVLQLSSDGAYSYLVLDAASRTCVVIDPVEALAGRIARLVHGQGLQVRAVLATDVDRVQDCKGLRAVLGEQAPVGLVDSFGWPRESAHAALGDGSQGAAMVLGSHMLVRLPRCEGAPCAVSYLLGAAGPAGLAADDVRFAFTGAAALPGGADQAMPFASQHACVERLGAMVNADTVLCPGFEQSNLLCSTPGAEGRAGGALAGLLALQPRLARPAAPATHSLSVIGLEPGALEQFLLTHPDATLVDVREAWEHAVCAAPAWSGRIAESVPLSRLPHKLAEWLRGEQRPLVFFCRSGARSAKAVQCLHRLGYRNAWHVAGGMALAA
jgi:cysteine sulfinate desulfinase/cysteine desulfurase-like protein/rhodanese-related sulfurtransferase